MSKIFGNKRDKKYEKIIGKTLTLLGNINNTTKTFDIKLVNPNYASLTVGNFILEAVNSSFINAYAPGVNIYVTSRSIAPSKSYNATTGILTVNCNYQDIEYGGAVRLQTQVNAYLLA